MSNQVLVDSNVLLDILEEDPVWCDWSSRHLAQCAEDSRLSIGLLVGNRYDMDIPADSADKNFRQGRSHHR